MANSNDRFIKTYTQGNSFTQIVQVWVDKKTGVNYVFMQSGYGGGLTPLLNADGKPVITPVYKD
ncbi:MAG: xylan 1,4-beta-xylosidase [Oscillospiraceae bacterium]|nr:xylan 1,4-beta-xylosidase [Oscillospiraceae bacterium]